MIADLSNGGAMTLGGSPMADTMYQNALDERLLQLVRRRLDWRGRLAPLFPRRLNSTDVAKQNLLVHSSWTYAPTDFNTWVLGPTRRLRFQWRGSCAWHSGNVANPIRRYLARIRCSRSRSAIRSAGRNLSVPHQHGRTRMTG